MKKVLASVVVLVALTACSDPKGARDVLIKSGYSNIVTRGWAPFWCGENDTFTTRFAATNPKGQRVEGAVCTSWFAKGGTVRF